MYLVRLSTPVLTDWTVHSCRLLLTAGTRLAAESIPVLLFHHLGFGFDLNREQQHHDTFLGT